MGRQMAIKFAEHGANVAIASRSMDHLAPTLKEIEATGSRGFADTVDVRDLEGVEALVEKVENELGPIDILVNNAAGNFVVPFDAMSPNAWASVTNIVLNGTFNVTRTVGQRMLEREKGDIVNVVATYAWQAAPLVSHSGAAKAGVLNLTRSLAVEWGGRGIRVNALAPGPVDTEGAGKRLFPDEETKQRILEKIPAGRFGTEEDMAFAAMLLLAHPYVNGDCLTVDGGMWLAAGAML